MNMRRKHSLTFLLLVLVLAAAGTQDMLATQDVDTILELDILTDAEPPRLLGDQLLLTYAFDDATPGERIHTVQAAFSHEGFGILHAFMRNQNGVFVLLMDTPPERDDIVYRLIVDGIWTTDPSNPHTVVDRWGVELSQLSLERPVRRRAVPLVHENGEVEFVLQTSPNSRVTVVGSFNGWDPFMTPLMETKPGVYRTRLRIGSGEHFYYYYVDGLRLADPENEDRRWHVSGQAVSVVTVR
jgi:hypothetical protein